MTHLAPTQIKSQQPTQQPTQRAITTILVVTSAFVFLRVAWLLNPALFFYQLIPLNSKFTLRFKIEPSEQPNKKSIANINYHIMVSKTTTQSSSNIARAGGAHKKKKYSAQAMAQQKRDALKLKQSKIQFSNGIDAAFIGGQAANLQGSLCNY